MFITRFAPSPTGFLHIGNLRTALIAWLYARHNHGKFLLRIDDTDLERSREECTLQLKKDLINCGLNWDEEECYQSQRTDLYNEFTQILKAQNLLYPCYETREELDIERKLCATNGKNFIYNRTASAQKTTHDKPHWRFKLNHDRMIIWQDLIKGEIKFDPRQISDPVVIREDGTFTYLLISVIDDIQKNITHIIRGEDHISNTATQIQMFEALKGPIPQFAHLALLKMPEGKISKRTGGFEIYKLLNEGILPITLLNYLSNLGSKNNISDFDLNLNNLVKNFDIKAFSSSSPNFSKEDLLRLNARILSSLSFDIINKYMLERFDLKINNELWEVIKGNIENFEDIKYWYDLCHNQISHSDSKIDNKEIIKIAIKNLLPQNEWHEKIWSEWVAKITNESGMDKKTIFMALRMILTDRNHGPEMNKFMHLMGFEKVMNILSSLIE